MADRGKRHRHQKPSCGIVKGAAPYGLVLALVVWAACGAGAGTMPASVSEVTVTDRDDRVDITLAAGQTLVVRLGVTLGAGFSWQVATNDARILKPAGPPRIEPPERPVPGAVEYQVFRFIARAHGPTVLELHYLRPWEKGVESARTYRVTVTVR
jgi:inhibitor of cysteine peptidase